MSFIPLACTMIEITVKLNFMQCLMNRFHLPLTEKTKARTDANQDRADAEL